jgi:hypothetical protein
MEDKELEECLEAYATKGKGLKRSRGLWHRFSVFRCEQCEGKRFQAEAEIPIRSRSLCFVGVLSLHCSNCGTIKIAQRVTEGSSRRKETLTYRETCKCGGTEFLVADFELLFESDLEECSSYGACTRCGKCRLLANIK